MNRNLHVVVLMGGWSSEREVSLTSGRGVATAFRERGWTNVTELDMDRDVAHRLEELKPDVVFNALHGVPGEDGTVQGMLDLMGISYTHSGLSTSAIAASGLGSQVSPPPSVLVQISLRWLLSLRSVKDCQIPWTRGKRISTVSTRTVGSTIAQAVVAEALPPDVAAPPADAEVTKSGLASGLLSMSRMVAATRFESW